MSVKRSTSKAGRKFGKDITNLVSLGCKPPCKQQILHNARIEKTVISSVNSISQYPQASMQGFLNNLFSNVGDSQKMVDQNTSWPPLSEGHRQTRDPVYDHAAQIRSYVREQSQLAVIQEDYMKWQVEIDKEKRQILISWLVAIHTNFNLKPETLFLAIHLVDQYGYKKCVIRSKYQLLGITCLFMAAKYEELRTPRLGKYLSECGGLYSREQVLCQEAELLEVMNFEINQIVLPNYLLDLNLDQIFTEIQQENVIVEEISEEQKQLSAKLCSYILELTLLEYGFCLLRPKYVSPVIIYIALKIKNIPGARSKRLMEMYELDETYFRECFQLINKLYKSRRQPRFHQINRKYGISEHSSKSSLGNYTEYTSSILHQQ